MFSKKTTKIDEIFNIDLTLCSKREINCEDFVNFRGLLRKCELYAPKPITKDIVQGLCPRKVLILLDNAFSVLEWNCDFIKVMAQMCLLM